MARATDTDFQAYHNRLSREIQTIKMNCDLWFHLKQRMSDRLEEMNLAPAFFGTVEFSLLSNVIVGLSRFYDGDRSERNLVRFINFVEQNIPLFTTDAMKKRKGLADDDWFVKRHEPVTQQTIDEHKKLLADHQSTIDKLFEWRDKQFVHLDKKYFTDPGKLKIEVPIKVDELRSLIDTGVKILNRYSTAFDGVFNDYDPVNRFDVDRVLDILAKYNEERKRGRRANRSLKLTEPPEDENSGLR